MERKLRYRGPAREWNEALPIGNGILGAMVFGAVAKERIQLNEDSLWYGGPRSRTNPDAAANLARIRELIFEGRIAEAERLSMLALAGVPEHPAHYVPVGDLILEFEDMEAEAEDYRRELDIGRALCSVAYRAGGVLFERECFASAPDKAIVLRIRADRPSSISCKVYFRRERYAGRLSHPDEGTLCMLSSGGGEGSVGFAAMARAIPRGGSVHALGETLVVQGADELILLVVAATSFRHGDPSDPCFRALDAAGRRSYEELRARHVADYRSLFDRMDLSLGPVDVAGDATGDATDERLAALTTGGRDPGLVELYFHFGRYLLISSSRPGSLPANLQGIWNDEFLPPWGSKYTINVNTEMNYWPAEPCNLGDCHLPLFDHLERMLPNGRRTAREMYGCRGFVAHHNTDLWGDCDPVDRWIPGSIWPMGAAWLSLHIWESYEYSGDGAFLDRYFPVMREAAFFFLDFLVQDPKGRLVTNPSVSPENTYILPGGERGSMCYGPSMDSQILRALFTACLEAMAALGAGAASRKALGDGALGDDALGGGEVGADTAFAAELLSALARLPEPAIGSGGCLMEWPEDYEEAEPGHRHISHLFALYPDDAITPRTRPELARAARATLDRRLAHGGGHTGWSKAWIVNLRARLGQGDEAWEDVEGLLRSSTLPNLLDNHPPFQIDGNFGGAAGILGLFLQSAAGEIALLPALPKAIPEGALRGARAKGGFEIDLEWRKGRLTQARIGSILGKECRVRASLRLRAFNEGRDGTALAESGEEGLLAFPTAAGCRYSLRPIDP